MARPVKNRIIQSIPSCEGFMPVGFDYKKEYQRITMTVDEYEAIRLIDLEGQNQEACAESMGISRSTVTNIYDSARKKMADAFINEKMLLIEGGNYHISSENRKTASITDKSSDLTVAVPYDEGNIFQHFGQCETFRFYRISGGRVSSCTDVSAEGYGHGTLVTFLKEHDADILICGGIGGGAQKFLEQNGIAFYAGVTGNCDHAVNRLLNGTLEYNTNATCSNHKDSCQCENN